MADGAVPDGVPGTGVDVYPIVGLASADAVALAVEGDVHLAVESYAFSCYA